ncbi:hypothetical protein GRI43_13610 [Altererythrobacter luteolus]|uniref:Uncharacterized protein n=1 Tax=Pontixanthobacter luteolus TaxID=295089 RepID=A0A6I4V3W6_9SPHN|nr:hypothetical protein [Pontixanthobacter luteolus]MXP48425.1 hypothetical protein [Pontixanthobacter luteolus]
MMAREWKLAIGASVLTLAAVATPAQAQDQTAQAEAANSDDGSEIDGAAAGAIVIGGVVSGYAASQMAESSVEAIAEGRNNLAKKSLEKFTERELARNPNDAQARKLAKKPSSLLDVQKASSSRKAATKAARPANVANTDLNKLLARGEAAQNARAAKVAGSADELADLGRRGDVSKAVRQNAAVAKKPKSNMRVRFRDQVKGPGTGSARVAGSADELADLTRRGDLAKGARSAKIAGSADELAELGRRADIAKGTRRSAQNVAKAASGGDTFARQLLSPKGAKADVAKLVAKADAAQVVRGGKLVNEGQLMRNIADKGGDISKINKAGRTAQVARGAGGLKAASTAGDAAKMAKAAKTAKMAKTAKTAATAAKIGKGGRAALAGTGVGAVIVVAEIAGTESVKALTGAELQDPVSTTFQYGAAIFDKDVTLGDVAKQRMDHHKENFRKIGETLTTKGKLKENLKAYGQEKGEKISQFAGKMDQADRTARAGLQNATGVKVDRVSDTRDRYANALAGDDKVKNVTAVAKDRAKHHTDNAKRAGKKIGCGIGNLFRKKDKDKKC